MEVVQIQGEHFFHVAESKKDPTAASSTEETLESRRLNRLKAFTSNKAILDNKEIKRKQLEAEKKQLEEAKRRDEAAAKQVQARAKKAKNRRYTKKGKGRMG